MMSLQSFYHVSTMNKLKDTKLLHIKDLFQFSTIVSVSTEFGGQMGVGGGAPNGVKLTSELQKQNPLAIKAIFQKF